MTRTDELVAGYLDRLRAATLDLPTDERDELLATIAEHIATATADLAAPTEADLMAILDRLGSPEEIAAAARGQSRGATTGPASERPGGLEWGGIAMLGVGSYVLPIVGTIAGLVMICLSKWWTTRQKVVAIVLSTVSAMIVPILVLGLFAFRTGGPSQNDPIVVPQEVVSHRPDPSAT